MKYLLKDIETIRAYLSNITPTIHYDNFTSELRAATIEFIIPYLGQTLYDELIHYYHTEMVNNVESVELPEVADFPLAKLLSYLQPALANYMALKYTPSSDTFFTSSGLQTIKGENQTAAFAYQKTDRMNKYAEDADTFMDAALEFLEENKAKYPSWIGNTETIDVLFTGTKSFSHYFDIGNSRRTYLRLLPTIRKVEQLKLIPVIGVEFYHTLKQLMKARAMPDAYMLLIDGFIRPALANLSISKALVEMQFKPKNNSVCVTSFYENAKDTSATFMEALIRQTNTDGDAYLDLLAKKIAENDGDKEPQTYLFQNGKDRKVFVI